MQPSPLTFHHCPVETPYPSRSPLILLSASGNYWFVLSLCIYLSWTFPIDGVINTWPFVSCFFSLVLPCNVLMTPDLKVGFQHTVPPSFSFYSGYFFLCAIPEWTKLVFLRILPLAFSLYRLNLGVLIYYCDFNYHYIDGPLKSLSKDLHVPLSGGQLP